MSSSGWSVMKTWEAISVGIGEPQLGAGMGPLTSTDGARTGWLGAELRGLQFTDGGALAGFPVLADGLLPGRLRCIQNRLADPTEEVQADRESQAQLPSSPQQKKA